MHPLFPLFLSFSIYLSSISLLFLPPFNVSLPLLSLSLSAAPPSCCITHGLCLKKEREGLSDGGGGRRGGVRRSGRERKKRGNASGRVRDTWTVNERLFPSGFPRCVSCYCASLSSSPSSPPLSLSLSLSFFTSFSPLGLLGRKT